MKNNPMLAVLGLMSKDQIDAALSDKDHGTIELDL